MKMSMLKNSWLLFIPLCLCAACSDEDHPEPDILVTAKCTVLAYVGAENSLDRYGNEDIKEMMQGAADIPSNDHFVIFLDNRSKTRLYEVVQNEKGVGDTICVHDFEGRNLNSADPAVMEEVLSKVKELFPAESYGLVVWSHGDGWLPGNSATSHSTSRAIVQDEKAQAWMSVWDMAGAVQRAWGMAEYIFFDACFMQGIEVAYELKDCCRYLVGSPCEIPGPGAPYHKVVKYLFPTTEGNSAEMIAQAYCDYYNDDDQPITEGGIRYGALLSVIDCSRVQAFAELTASYVTQFFSRDAEIQTEGVIQYGYFPEKGSANRRSDWKNLFYDIEDVMRNNLSEADFRLWKAQYDTMVIRRPATSWWFTVALYGLAEIDLSHYGGVNMFVPQANTVHRSDFHQTQWYEMAGWKACGW